MRKTVAIVGRPNVGKSALFNRLAGKNISIVHDRPGVTRDRITAECRRGPEVFDIMDTGGIGANTDDELTAQVQVEASIALDVADLLLFVVDVKEGLTPIDLDLARQMRKVAKPVILVCNKADSEKRRAHAPEFARMGFQHVVEVSAAHGLGIPDLMVAITTALDLRAPVAESEGDHPDQDESPKSKKRRPPRDMKALPLKLAIVGRPNAGKSSFVNAVLGKNRAIVSPLAGTTRDSLDIHCEYRGREYVLIDTAGIRRQAKVHDYVENFSVQRALHSIERADICVLMIDSNEGIRAQDRKIAQLILEAHKPCIIVMNKYDLWAPKLEDRMERLREHVKRELFFLHFAPYVMTSANTGTGVDRVFKAIERVRDGAQKRIGTGVLNRILHHAVENSPGPLGAGPKIFKLLYATQVNDTSDRAVPVPHFVLFANRVHRMQDSYLRFLEGRIREEFPGEGLPFFIKIKAKTTKGEFKE